MNKDKKTQDDNANASTQLKDKKTNMNPLTGSGGPLNSKGKPRRVKETIYYDSDAEDSASDDITAEMDKAGKAAGGNPSGTQADKSKIQTSTTTGSSMTQGPTPSVMDSSPDAGTAIPGVAVAEISRLTESIKQTVMSDELTKFSQYETNELIFTPLETGKYPINGEMLVVVDGKIPTLFSFESHWDENLMDKTTADENVGPGPVLPEQAPECIGKSIEMIKDGTYSVRLVVNPKNYPIKIFDENVKNIYTQVVVVGSQYNAETSTMEYSRRLQAFFRLCRAFNMVVRNISKSKMNEVGTENPVFSGRMNLWKEDNPHPYFGLLFHPIQWFTEEMTKVVKRAPLDTNEYAPISDNNQKVETTIACVTDQFTAMALRNAKRRIDENILTPRAYTLMVASCAHSQTDIRIIEPKPALFLKYYAPTKNAWNTTMIRLLADVGLRNSEILFMVQELVKTQTFEISSLAGFMSAIATASGENHSVISQVFPAIGTVSMEGFCRMLLLENFAWGYNISFTSGVGIDFNNCALELLSMLITFVTFPKMVQAGASSFGYRLMKIIEVVDNSSYSKMVDKYGEIMLINDDGSFSRESEDLRALTNDETHAGKIYSVYSPAIQRDTSLPEWLQLLGKLLNRQLKTRLLERKRAAGLPYTRDNYMAYSSWGIDPTRNEQRVSNKMKSRVNDAVKVVEALITKTQNPKAQDRSMITPQRGVFQTIMRHIDTISSTCSSLYFTMEFISEIIQNSYLYCHEGYEPIHPALRPQWISLGPYFGSQNVPAAAIVRQTVEIDARAGMGILITVSGGFERPRTTVENVRANYTYAEQTKTRSVLPMPSEAMAQRGLDLAKDSFRFSEAMNILEFMSDRLKDNDPIFDFSRIFSDYLQMRTFSDVIDSLATVFDVNLRGVMGNILVGANIGDYRTESLMLSLVDRYTNHPQTEQQSAFGRHIQWADPISKDNISMAAALMLSDASPAIRSNKRLLIANVDAKIIRPRMELPIPKRVIDYTRQLLRHDDDDRTRGVVFFLPDEDGNGEIMIESEKDERLTGIRLRVKTFGDLAPEHVGFITRSIMFARLSIEATDHPYSYDINYILDNTKTIYDEKSGEAKSLVRSILSSKTGQYLHIVFPDTTYAVKRHKFNSTIKVNTGYVFPLDDVRTNEVINGIYDQSSRPAEFFIDKGDQFGSGPGGNFTPVNLLPKRQAEANMNNLIPVYTTNVQFSGVPQLVITPVGYV
jgi:hypothetical protein